MKKLLFLGLIVSAAVATPAFAQPSQKPTPQTVDKASMLQQMKDQQKSPMMAKTGLTAAQVDRILEINLEVRMEAAASLQGLTESERTAKLAEIKAIKEKRYSEIPLTGDQIKSVYAFYEDLAKSMQPKSRN